VGENGKRKLELIGKIILADFLEYRLDKFINFVQAVEALPLYKKLTREGIIIRKPLLDAKIVREEKESVSVPSEAGVIAKIKKGSGFHIHYTNEEFSIEHIVDEEKQQGIINDVKVTEKEDIRNGRVKKPYTDGELRCKLNLEEYDLSITKRAVAYCRKDMGILPSSKILYRKCEKSEKEVALPSKPEQ